MKKIFTLMMMLVATLTMQAQDTWTVAGTTSLLGVDWAPAEAANDMTSTDGVNFTLVKEGRALKAGGKYEFKVVKNHAWDESYGNAEGGNANIEITENGTYTVTFTFNAETKEVGATGVKTGEADFGEATYTIAGVAPLCGSEWKQDDTANDLTSTDGKTYTWKKENVAMEANTPYGFKIVVNHDWSEAYPEDNYQLTVPENGKYTVVITFNSETKEIAHQTTKTGEAEFGEKVWTIAGVANLCGSEWAPDDATNDMTKVEDGVFELVKKNLPLVANNYEFKVVANHSWAESYGNEGGNQTLVIEEDGNYDVTFTFMVETKTLEAVAEKTSAAGIQNVKNSKQLNGTIYNLKGQRIAAGFRGIAIQDGRKIVVK